jgi:multisubunit Na+/H+ antiporter MnhC subunit
VSTLARADAQAWGRAAVWVLKRGGTCIGALPCCRSGLCVARSQREARPLTEALMLSSVGLQFSMLACLVQHAAAEEAAGGGVRVDMAQEES